MKIFGQFLGVVGMLCLFGSLSLAGAERSFVMGTGSTVVQVHDLHFGFERQKTFCDGIETHWFRAKFLKHCCSIQVFPKIERANLSLTLKAKYREIHLSDEANKFCGLEAEHLTIIQCRGQAPTANQLERAFGGLFQVQVIVPVDDYFDKYF